MCSGGFDVDIDITRVEPEPYEVVSATFDRSFYQLGSTAALTIVTKSNWGAGSDLTLVPVVAPAIGDDIHLFPQLVSFTPGQEQTSVFEWPVPYLEYCTFWDVRVELWDSGELLLAPLFDKNVPTNAVDPEQTEQVQAQMVECSAGAACLTQVWSVIPYLGLLVNQQASANLSCLADAYQQEDDEKNARLFRFYEASSDFLTILELSSYGAAVVTGGTSLFLELADVVGGLALLEAVCAGEWAYWATYGCNGIYRTDSAPPLGTYVRELADSIRATIHLSGIPYQDVLLVEGQNIVRIFADSCYSTGDSAGLVGATVFDLGPNVEATWTHLRPGLHCFGTVAENPHSVSRVEVRPDGADSLSVILLHRLQTGELVNLSYPTQAVDSATVFQVHLVDTLSLIPLEVDLDGDATIDTLILADQAAGVAVRSHDAGSPAAISARAVPNPARESLTFRLQVGRLGAALAIEVNDATGRRVRTLPLGALPLGTHYINWDCRSDAGAPVADGVYFYRVLSGPQTYCSGIALVLR